MKKILHAITIFGLINCTRTDKTDVKPDTKLDSVTSNIKTSDDYESFMRDYEASYIYSDSDSDSLLLDEYDIKEKFLLFQTKGNRTNDQKYSGGDCEGKIRRFVYNRDTLTIDKYGCGDYGFGNSQYLTFGDSLKLVRQYTMEWSAEVDTIEYIVREKIFRFNGTALTINEREKNLDGWNDFHLKDTPFKTSTNTGQSEYLNFKRELKELQTRTEL